MLANLFRKTKIISLSLGAVLVFLLFLFYHNSTEGLVQNTSGVLWDVIRNTALLILGLALLIFSNERHRHLEVYPIHMLAFVLILFYLPSGEVRFKGLLFQFILGLAWHYNNRIFQSKEVLIPLFNLSLLLSALWVFEPFALVFFVSPLLLFLNSKFRQLKIFLCFLIPIGITLLWASTLFHFLELPFVVNGRMWTRYDKWMLPKENTYLLIGFLFLVFLRTLKGIRSKEYNFYSGSQTFLLIWLFSGLYLSFYGGTTTLNSWELILFPAVYFFGLYLNKESDKMGTILTLLLVVIKGISLVL
jgi:hypothetical protein